jgi:hypothetical protein
MTATRDFLPYSSGSFSSTSPFPPPTDLLIYLLRTKYRLHNRPTAFWHNSSILKVNHLTSAAFATTNGFFSPISHKIDFQAASCDMGESGAAILAAERRAAAHGVFHPDQAVCSPHSVPLFLSPPEVISFTLCPSFLTISLFHSSVPLKDILRNMSFTALLSFLSLLFLANAASQCYMLNGILATSDFQPCTSNLASGSNSACCNLGKNPPDICLGGGLCQRMDSAEGNFLIYAVGCTDSTGKDAACPQYCPSACLPPQLVAKN